MGLELGRRKFVCRFAAGERPLAASGLWRVWSAKNKPDLYLAVEQLSGSIKSTIHCPRADQPTWKRHFGFAYGARGEVADAVRAEGRSRHQTEWSGARFGYGITLEWRILIPGSSLRKEPKEVSGDISLLPSPNEEQCLIVFVFLGPAIPTPTYPRIDDAQLLSRGELSDGRCVWITYCYVPFSSLKFQVPTNPHPRFYGSAERLRTEEGELRTAAVADHTDGSLVFWDLRVERIGSVTD